jgi:hypothetical protein
MGKIGDLFDIFALWLLQSEGLLIVGLLYRRGEVN